MTTEEDEKRQVEACLFAVRKMPEKCAVVYRYQSKTGAHRCAQKINLGLHELIDSSVYWAGHMPGSKAGEFEVFVGSRDHIPNEWRTFVTGE